MTGRVEDAYLLVVEDHDEMRSQLVQLIAYGLPGSVVHGVGSGEAALQFGERARLLAAVIDVGLPGMDGIATTRVLRAGSPDLPVIVMSMHASSLYEQESRAAGAAAFVTKGDVADKLVPALRQLLPDFR